MIRTLRERLIAACVLVFASVLALLAVGEEKRQSHATVDLYLGVPVDAKLLQLDKRALDEAYHAYLLRLWGVWLTEGAKDPKFFQNGLSRARRAYNQAAKQISDREAELKAVDPPF